LRLSVFLPNAREVSVLDAVTGEALTRLDQIDPNGFF